MTVDENSYLVGIKGRELGYRELWLGNQKILPNKNDIFRDFPNYNRLYEILTTLLPNHPVYPMFELSENRIDQYDRPHNAFMGRIMRGKTSGNPHYTWSYRDVDKSGIVCWKIISAYKGANRRFQSLNTRVTKSSENNNNYGTGISDNINIKPSNSLTIITLQFLSNVETDFINFRLIDVKLSPNKIEMKSRRDNSYEAKEPFDFQHSINLVGKYVTIAVLGNYITIQVGGMTVIEREIEAIADFMGFLAHSNCDYNMYEMSRFTTAHLSEDQKEQLRQNQLDRINRALKIN